MPNDNARLRPTILEAASESRQSHAARALLIEWLKAAEPVAGPDAVPDLTMLVDALGGSAFFVNTSVGRGDDGLPRIVFSAYAPRNTELKQRTMYPAHAALLRIMELGGASFNFHQPQPGANYQLRMNMRGVGLTNATRILFGGGQSRDIVERKDADYHDIVPANYILRVGKDREAVMGVIADHDQPLAQLFLRLCALADLWHGSDLKVTR